MDRQRPPLAGDELKRQSVPPSDLSLRGLVRHMIQMELTRLQWYRDGVSQLPRIDGRTGE